MRIPNFIYKQSFERLGIGEQLLYFQWSERGDLNARPYAQGWLISAIWHPLNQQLRNRTCRTLRFSQLHFYPRMFQQKKSRFAGR